MISLRNCQSVWKLLVGSELARTRRRATRQPGCENLEPRRSLSGLSLGVAAVVSHVATGEAAVISGAPAASVQVHYQIVVAHPDGDQINVENND